MSAKKFKFVSPGVFLSEIDNSQLPKIPGGVGPVVIGRTRRGPAMKPVKVSSFKEFVDIFGEPLPGNESEDPWRDGNGLQATSYAPYAAQAYLKADIDSPVTVIRLLGVQGDDASDTGEAGWEGKSAFGIFACPGVHRPSLHSPNHITASLCGIIYTTDATVKVAAIGTSTKGDSMTAINNSASAVTGDTTTVQAVKVASNNFTIGIMDGTTTVQKKVSFREGETYIRDQLNTNPAATNTAISYITTGSLNEKYWLGETFEETYEEVIRNNAGGSVSIFVCLLDSEMDNFKSSNHQLSEAKSGWVIPQHTGTPSSIDPQNAERLFRFCSVQEGEQSLDLNVSIENIKIADTGNPSPYGRFDVVVRQKRANRMVVVDSYQNLNLNPNSENFIARVIGDQYFEWDSAQKRNKLYGNYQNRSAYIRVEMGPNVGENGPTEPRSVPFGFLGPIKPVNQASAASSPSAAAASFAPAASGWVAQGATTIALSGATSLTLAWPTAPHVTTGSLGIDLVAKYKFGGTPYNRAHGTNDISYTDVNKGMKDYLRKFSSYGSSVIVSNQVSGLKSNSSKYAYVFTLDDIVISGSGTVPGDLNNYSPAFVDFVENSHKGPQKATATIEFTGNPTINEEITITSTDGTAITYKGKNEGNSAARTFRCNAGAETSATQLKAAIEDNSVGGGHGGKITVKRDGAKLTLTQAVAGTTGNVAIASNLQNTTVVGFQGGATHEAYTATTSGSAAALLDLVDCFSMPLVGGCDGVDVTEADPFNMSTRTIKDKNTRNSYAYASIDRAIELIRDPETVEMNLACMPGVTNASLTRKLVQTCEARADALAIIDLPDVYKPPFEEKCSTFKQRIGTTPEAAAKDLVQRQLNSSYGAAYYPWVKIRDVVNGRDIWAPPSVVALGIMGYTEQRDEVWFAPAGFNRGGLNEGNAGLPVLQVSEQLLSSQRDRLYEANINPIASFVSEGLVVFGQKTLQMTPSALDRINVRRLLIFVKKRISQFSNELLFDQNVPSTWNRFTGLVVPFLESVKTRLGLSDFKVVLDRSTTTEDLIDRNIMYAKIFLKPARAIEFIAVDFVITRSGASFND